MATSKPRFSVTIDTETMGKVDEYQKRQNYKTQSKAIVDLVRVGLAELQKEKPTVISDSGLAEITEIFQQLSSDNQSKLLELSRLYLDAQHKSEGTK